MFSAFALLAGIAAPSVVAWSLPPTLNDLFGLAPMTPIIVETYKSWSNATCYADLYGNGRQLPNTTEPPLNAANMTVETCLDYCESLKFLFAGLEYGYDCYCGNERPEWYWISNKTECDQACSGMPMEICGGDQHLLVYERLNGTRLSSSRGQ